MSTTAKIWFAQFVDDEGAPVAGVKVYHYEAGTTTDKDVYRDQAKSTTETQPVQGDSTGFVKFFGDGTYRLRIVSNEDILLYDLDAVEITGSNQGTSSRILFYGSSGAITDDDDLTWDSTNKRLGVGTTTNITENIVMKPGGFLAGERTGAGTNEGAKRLIGLNSSNKVSIDPQGQGTVLENLPAKGLLYLDENGQIQVLTLTNGQLPIGSAGLVPVAALPIAGAGMEIVEGAGSLTFAQTGARVYNRTNTLSENNNNSTTEHSVYSFTINGGDLSSNKSLEIFLGGIYQSTAGGVSTLTIKIKLNGVVMYEDVTAAITQDAAVRPLWLLVQLGARAANQIYLHGHLVIGNVAATTTGSGDIATSHYLNTNIRGSSAQDTSSSVLFDITFTHSVADASIGFARDYARAILY